MDTNSLDIGLLVFRLALGLMIAAHGLNKVAGAGGLDGTARWFESLGLRPGWVHARLAAATELGAGVLMVAGLVTPLAAAALVGLMTVAALTDHRGKGFFVFKGGWEYVAFVGLTAAAVAFTGPGRWSLDHVLDISLEGAAWALGGVLFGLAAGAAMVLGLRRAPASVGSM